VKGFGFGEVLTIPVQETTGDKTRKQIVNANGTTRSDQEKL